MKNHALFSSKDKSKKLNVVCCNFCLVFLRLTLVTLITVTGEGTTAKADTD